MFSKRIASSAKFLKMPISSQCLYFHLGLHADDDGIVEAYTVMNSVGASEDDIKVLVTKGFVYVLNEDLVSYITDWNENNKIRADRKIDSIYKELLLQVLPDVKLIQRRGKENSSKKKQTDNQMTTNGQPNDNQMTAQDRLGKDRLGKVSIVEDAATSETDKNLSEAVKAYEANIGTISEKAIDGITEWLEKGADISLIIFAIEQAAEYNARNWKYADTVISNHYNAGRKTKADAEVFGKSIKKASISKKDAPYDGYALDDMAAIERKARLERMKGNIDNGQA